MTLKLDISMYSLECCNPQGLEQSALAALTISVRNQMPRPISSRADLEFWKKASQYRNVALADLTLHPFSGPRGANMAGRRVFQHLTETKHRE